jgi:Uma2 family endonuclease
METVISKKSTISSRKSKLLASVRAGKRMTLEQFLAWNPEVPGIKFEWKNGEIVTEYVMKKEERFIIDNIIRYFSQTEDYKNGNSLMAEADVDLSSVSTYRRPDACYLTREQIKSPATAPQAPLFVIELASPSNTGEDILVKVKEYFSAGTQVVWIIYPDLKLIYVYTGIKTVKICSDGDICSASPAVPELQMTVNEIFS